MQNYKAHLTRTCLIIGILCCCWILTFSTSFNISRDLKELAKNIYRPDGPPCPQTDTLTPKANKALWDAVNAKIGTPEFEGKAVHWLARAVRIPTESYDGMGPVGVDSRWEVMGHFHDYLFDAFPLVHKTLKLTKVNTYGLYFEWKGSDPTRKPLLLAAHQDVVPVDSTTEHEWKYPPYSGYFDGERIWGRGSFDDKSGLIGIMITVETLITSGFHPTRTLVLSFGFDEEVSGSRGAGFLGRHLENLYGKNGIVMIVDEGAGFGEQFGSVVATPGISEKGYLDTHVRVTAPGGHSSVPPSHTSIGILSALLVEFEQNPTKVAISRHEPIYETLICVAKHSKAMPSHIRNTIKRSATSDRALRHLQGYIQADPVLSSTVSNTQAIDVIHGGVKSNALPEQAWAIVNHRIAVVSSFAEVKARDTKLLAALAKKFNLTYQAFGISISEEGVISRGALTLSDPDNTALEPAPITPTTGVGEEAAPYRLLSGTIKAAYNAHRTNQGNAVDPIIVAPSIMSGNTDTKHYWNLTKHIFRYSHHNTRNGTSLGSIHTVNESMEVDAFLEMIRFYTTLILNLDESLM